MIRRSCCDSNEDRDREITEKMIELVGILSREEDGDRIELYKSRIQLFLFDQVRAIQRLKVIIGLLAKEKLE